MNGASFDRGGKAHAVFTPGGAHPVGRHVRVVGVDEVIVGAVRDPLEQSQPPAVLDAIPTHVGHLTAGREPSHHAGQDFEATSLAEFLATREEQLVAQTDAEKRPGAVERTTQ